MGWESFWGAKKKKDYILTSHFEESGLSFWTIIHCSNFGFCPIFQMMFIPVVIIKDCFAILIIRSANFHLASNPNNLIWRWLTSLLVHQHLLNQMFYLCSCQEWASFYDQLSRQACQSRHHWCVYMGKHKSFNCCHAIPSI